MQKPPKVVAITGASGYIGTRLLMQLETNPEVGKIVAFDLKPLPYPIHNISFYQQDVSEPFDQQLRRHEVDTLVHLACSYTHTYDFRGWAEASGKNSSILDTTQKTCAAAGVRHVIFLSSHSVYGLFADNPVPITEAAVTRSRPGDFLGEASLVSDLLMQEFLQKQRDVEEGSRTKVTILRACPILGYAEDHERAEHVFPDRFWGTGENPPFQFVHELDMAHLLEEVIQQEPEGIFNVAGEGVVFLRELAEITRKKLPQVPVFLAHPATKLTSGLGQGRPSAWNLNTARYPIIMSTAKVKQALNYRFGYTSMEALNAFVNYNGL